MIILTNPWLFQILPNPPRGMALFPFILLREKSDLNNEILINHEKIHLRQELELLILPFYFLYLLNYTINLIKYKNHFWAYRQICFEREAYTNEADLNYLTSRRFANFRKFI